MVLPIVLCGYETWSHIVRRTWKLAVREWGGEEGQA
jgi:hypothetical protein